MDPHTYGRSSGIKLEDLPSQPPATWDPFRAAPTTTPHPYYSTFPLLSEQFCDLDLDSTYQKCEAAVLSPTTSNFIVDFGGAPGEGGAAWCALNIGDSDQTIKAVKGLLKKQVLILVPRAIARYIERSMC